jgi:hypothetical protein
MDHGRFNDLEELARAAGSDLCLVLAVIVELREIQRELPAEVTRRAFRLAGDRRVKLRDRHAWDDQQSALNAVTALVEASLQQAVCTTDEAVAVLSQIFCPWHGKIRREQFRIHFEWETPTGPTEN